MADVNRTAQVLVTVKGSDELRQLQAHLNQAGVRIQNMNRAMASNSTGFGKYGSSIQNVSYQVQDFAVQLAGGTSAAVALGQQLPQVTSAFGPMGAAMGAVLAVAIPLSAIFLTQADRLKAFQRAVTDAAKRTDDLRLATRGLLTGMTAEELRLVDAIQQQTVAMNDLLDKASKVSNYTAGNLRSAEDMADADRDRAASMQQQIDAAKAQLKTLQDQQVEYQRQLDITNQIKTLEDARSDQLKQRPALYRQIVQFQQQTARAQQLIAQYGTDAAQAFYDTQDRAQRVADKAQQLRDELGYTVDEAQVLAQEFVKSEDAAQRLRDFVREVNAETSAAGRAAKGFGLLMEATRKTVIQLKVQLSGVVDILGRIGRGFSALGDAATGGALSGLLDAIGAVANSSALTAAGRNLADLGRSMWDMAQDALNAADSVGTTSGVAGAGVGVAGKPQSLVDALARLQAVADGAGSQLDILRRQYAQLQADLANPELTEDILKIDPDLLAQGMQQAADEIHRLELELSGAQDVIDIFGNGLKSAFDSIIDGTASVADAFNSMLAQILADVAKFLVSQQIQSLLNIFASLFGGNLAGVMPGVFSGGAIPAAPTAPRALAFSAPAAASVPVLARVLPSNPGFNAANSSAARNNNSVNVVINNNTNGMTSVSAEQNKEGDLMITLEAMIDQRVKGSLSSGALDKTMSANYGLRRKV